MKKIRILTFWGVPNYGCFLQAYALQKVLQNQFPDCDVKHIAHLHQKHYESYYEKSITGLNVESLKNMLSNLRRYKDISSSKEFLKYYDVIPNERINDIDYMDSLILGSDIIWDYAISKLGNDPYLFGCNLEAYKKIAYAPSCGTVTSETAIPEYVKSSLQDLNSISVRDKKSQKIVENITGKCPMIVLDPTLLYDFNTDDNIKKPGINEKFIVVYGSYFTDVMIKEDQEYANENELSIVCLSSLDDKYSWCDITINQDKLTPFEWLGYFKYAESIMTCTYHGLLFGLIFKKKIVFNMTEFIMNKAEILIDELGLSEVLTSKTGFKEKISWDWDYRYISKKIDDMRTDSMKYLIKSVG